MLRKVYWGEFPAAISTLAGEADLVAKLAANDDSLGELRKELNDVMRAIRVAESVVAIGTGSGPPKASLRELVRSSSAPDDRAAGAGAEANSPQTDVLG